MVNASPANEYKLDKILSSLEELKREVSQVKAKLEEAPSYGSEEWWDWSDKQAMEDIKAGRYKTFKSVKELTKHLDSLK
ncbi:hypothetical protein A2960_03685 [Candidatus Gottesmanbacteria bacterium RIFCSPLOWO2_01_FULL_39_12b]|uniref:Uncharacterized protein n=1 Tax=Candidatus Gottesmanbacteria bacterium RIFCSPLOWO2_01_FULL_39_12b TaxID=1798388 RepID=A0A1F6APH1_9BACT|nr:MAG: hypothetical protein A2960_03685 [Candidatus Gottesmanbacteria bacterium RIFCSPLOWO2_01_FULL_39_12b]